MFYPQRSAAPEAFHRDQPQQHFYETSSAFSAATATDDPYAELSGKTLYADNQDSSSDIYGSADQQDYSQASSPFTVGSILSKAPKDNIATPKMIGISSSNGPSVDYIFQDEQKIRGHHSLGEKLCYNIGSMYAIGLATGGIWGVVEGLRNPVGDTFKLKLNSFLNATTRRGPLIGNSAGVTTLFYTTLTHGLSRFRGQDDIFNHIGAASLAGILFKSTAGVKTALKTGAVFGGVAAVGAGAYSMFIDRQD